MMTRNNRSKVRAGVVALAACVISVPAADAEVAWADLPKAVQDALAKINPDKNFESVDREEEDGFVIYEAEYETKSGEAEITLTAAGDIIEMESEIDTNSLPTAITDRIEQDHPGAKIGEASITREDYCEVEFQTSAGEIEIAFYANGSEREGGDDRSRRGGGGGFGGGGFDETMSWEDLPKVVQESLTKSFLFAEFETLERDEKDGIVYFKARFQEESGQSQVRLTEAGNIIEVRTRVDAESIPRAVKEQIEKEFPDARIESASLFQNTYYAVALDTQSGEIEVGYFADGNVSRYAE